MVRVALDVKDPALGVLCAIAEAVQKHPAADRAVGAVVASLTGAQQLVLARLAGVGDAGSEAEGRGARAGGADGA